MAFIFKDLGIAASVYLGVFVLYLCLATYVVIKKGLKTKFTALLLYGVIRLGGQISGIGFAVNGFHQPNWLVAYLILGAEGYFGLVMATLFFLINEHVDKYGKSPLETLWTEKRLLFIRASYKSLFHWSLVPANILLIVGGTKLAHASPEELAPGSLVVTLSKILRTVGQVIFLLNSVSVSGLTLYSYFKGIRTISMYLLILVIPFITVRGIFGVLSIYIAKMNYFDLNNYKFGANNLMAIYEYLLGITMEFVSAFTMLNIYWVKRDSKVVSDVEEVNDGSIETKA